MEEVAGMVADLIKEGKVRFFGLTEAGAANIRRAHAVCPVSARESEYSLWERNLEEDIVPVLDELGIGLVPFCPLGSSFLTGKVTRAEDYPKTDTRHSNPRYQGANFEANVRATKLVQELAEAKNVKLGQIALAWLLYKGQHIVPIPGTRHITYLEENLASDSIRLNAEEMQTLDFAMGEGKVAGNRYPDWVMKAIDR